MITRYSYIGLAEDCEMRKYEQDMTQGSLWKKIWLYSLPLMATNVLQVLFNLADLAVVGRFGGSGALGSVGSTTQLVTLFTGFIIGMSGGINVLVALARGERNSVKAADTVHTAAVLSLLTGLFVMLIGLFWARPMLALMNTRPELIDGAVLYFRIYFLGMPALAMYNFGNAVLSAVGDTRRPLYCLSLSGVINVILNLVFAIIFDMGVAGVAWASVISQYLSAFLLLTILLKQDRDYKLDVKMLKLKPDIGKEILRLGIPAGMQAVIFQVANVFVQTGVNSFDTVTVEGTVAAANADGIIYELMAALYTACSTFISQNFGAGCKDRVMKCYVISVINTVAVALVFGLVISVFGRQFLGMFTSDQAVLEAGMIRLRIMGLSYWISVFMDGSIAASRGLGQSAVPTVLVLLGSCAFRLVWIYTVFGFFGTIESLYLLYACSWTLTGAAETWYFMRLYKRTVKDSVV